MEITVLEIDGSLDNPMAIAAVAIWTVVLSGLAVTAVHRRVPLVARIAAFALAIASAAATRAAQDTIGSVLHSVLDWRLVAVSFWSGPPAWIAPLVAGGAALAAWTVSRRRPSSRPRQVS